MTKVLCVLNYYYPYISGVSEYARVVCEEMVKQGYDVTVLTSNHAHLPKQEVLDGVKVVRAAVLLKISKGTVSPQFITLAYKMARSADLVWLNLPMIESGIISSLIEQKKLSCIYQCDLNLPKSLLNSIILKVMDISNRHCLKRCRKVFVTSADYGRHSRLACRFADKLVEAGAPIKDYSDGTQKAVSEKKVIGFCGRIVEEKGINVLLDAFAMILEKRDDVVLRVGGDYENVAGGSVYPQLQEQIRAKNIKNVEFLGRISDEDMGSFYTGLDVFVLPSINSLEAFGMVQVEAMICGTPVVATDLYGVRTIVHNTGMGVVVKRNDARSLARGVIEVLDHPERYIKTKADILQCFGTERCVRTIMSTMENMLK